MSTGYSWEGIRQVCVTLLGARHVPARLCGGHVHLWRYIKCSTFFSFYHQTFPVLYSFHAAVIVRVDVVPSLHICFQ